MHRDLALDLGTATVQGAVTGQGVVLREPSLAAADRQTGQVLAVGQAAREMLDRTPGGFAALRPIQGGVVTDSGVVQAMVQTFWKKALGKGLGKPRLLLSVPTGISPVEERALMDAALQAGAGKVFLMEAPLAAALGAGRDVHQPEGQLVVSLGAGVTDGAVIEKQCALIERVHEMGAEALLSCHPGTVMSAEQVVELALFLEKRKPDIIKIVTAATNEEEMIEAIKAMVLLKKEVKTPVSYHANDQFGGLTRIVNPTLGGQIAFCVDRFTETSTVGQLDLKTTRTVLDNITKLL